MFNQHYRYVHIYIYVVLIEHTLICNYSNLMFCAIQTQNVLVLLCVLIILCLISFVYYRVENLSNVVLFCLKIQVKYRISPIDFS